MTGESENLVSAAVIDRCDWCGDDPLYRLYHDQEWGVPIYDDRLLFEFLCLEGAQAGLSWITVLRKRPHYRAVFDQFDAEKMAGYDEAKVASLLADPGIIRNKLKVNGFVKNARAYLALKECEGDFSDWLWRFVDNQTIQNKPSGMADIPSQTDQSVALSKALKKAGFTFVGPTICYAFMQASGMVNDHLVTCFRHRALSLR
jgi:DNA-3-methyladenine glycosylase I